MDTLVNLRKQIDNIDDKIIQLLDERMKICQQVGQVKKDNNIGLTHTSRENDIIDRLSTGVSLTRDDIKSIYEKIFIVSKSKQI